MSTNCPHCGDIITRPTLDPYVYWCAECSESTDIRDDNPKEAEGWSVSQKEAIRAELALLMGLSSVAFREEVDGDLVKSLINKTMLVVEAITKGEEQ